MTQTVQEKAPMPDRVKTYVQAPGVEIRTVGEDTFLVAAELGAIHHLSVVGAAVWRQLETPMREDDIVALLTAAFPDVPAEEIRTHTATLLEDLEDCQLVMVDPPEAEQG